MAGLGPIRFGAAPGGCVASSAARRDRIVHSSDGGFLVRRPDLASWPGDRSPRRRTVWNAVWHDGTLVGFIDWDTAGPSSGALDLAFAALSWVPLLPAGMARAQGFTAFEDRSRRLHLLLDSYGYHADRAKFGDLVAGRARINAAGIHRLAGHDPVYASLLPMAATYEQAAKDVDDLPDGFWSRISDGR